MTAFSVVLAPEAEDDIAGAFQWYRERSVAAADAFREEVQDAIDQLATTAARWRADEAGHRRRLVKHFPYSVVYELQDAQVTVLAVAHHRRRPGYWRK